MTTDAADPLSSAAPRVARRGGLGVGAVLLALAGLTAGTQTDSRDSLAGPEQALLKLDPDTATREELMLLPRIGPALADHIIEYREARRPDRAFQCAEDLDNVRQIGPVTVARLRPLLCFPPKQALSIRTEVSTP